VRKDSFRWLKRATKIVVTDPRIRQFYQQRNVIDLVATVLRSKEPDDLLPIKALRIAE
jgi:hypothetical protein